MKDTDQPKTAIVTGATGAIGRAIAMGIAASGYRLIIVARNETKAQHWVSEIQRVTGNSRVDYLLVDLSCRKEIFELAEKWCVPLDLLINNAAVTPRNRLETPEGIELQFATNVLGYFWMTKAFRPHLAAANQSRIVDIASYWAGGLDLNDLEFTHRQYTNGAAYRQSKQANRMLAVAWAEELFKEGISINTCHPGDVNSTLSNNLGFGGSQTPAQGAETPLWLATSPSGVHVTGKYFEYKRETTCRFGEDLPSVRSLFEICHGYV
jgi:NAD(P)-dependent dehydrogenase (short-subunit alcohol dehydrogenase family)